MDNKTREELLEIEKDVEEHFSVHPEDGITGYAPTGEAFVSIEAIYPDPCKAVRFLAEMVREYLSDKDSSCVAYWRRRPCCDGPIEGMWTGRCRLLVSKAPVRYGL